MDAAELYRVRSDPTAAAAFVRFHVAREPINAENVYDGKVVDSLAAGQRLRVQCVLHDCGVEGRRIGFQPGRGTAVHVVDGVLLPPAMSVQDLVRNNDSFR